MSAKDDLDKFDREWRGHLDWRKGRTFHSVERGGGGESHIEPPGQYLRTTGVADATLVLKELPGDLRSAIIADLEATVGALVDAKMPAIRRELVKAAAREARCTLKELEELES